MDEKSEERIQSMKQRLLTLDHIERRKNEHRAHVLEGEIERMRYCLRPCVVVRGGGIEM